VFLLSSVPCNWSRLSDRVSGRYNKKSRSLDQFTQRSLNNYENRCLYHHLFNVELLEKMCADIGSNVISQSSIAQNRIFSARV